MTTFDDALAEIAVIPAARAVGMTPADYLELLPALWQGWMAHPAYPNWVKMTRLPPSIHDFSVTDLINPHAVGAFKHPPGIDGLTESYIVGDVCSIAASIVWARRSMGDFSGLLPLEPHVPVDLYMVITLNHSYMGRGQAYFCRKRLRELLPKHLRPAISKARSLNAKRKDFLAPYTGYSPDDWDFETHKPVYPPEYLSKTKKALALEYVILPQYPDLPAWIEPGAFWDAATGKMRPEAVEVCGIGYTHRRYARDGAVITQTSMFDMR